MGSGSIGWGPMPDTHIRVRNWEKFQHYRHRNPPWIRLYNELLENYDFARLQDASKWHAVGLWLLASRLDNRIPDDQQWIQSKTNSSTIVDLDALISAGFIERYDNASGELATCKQSAKPEKSRVEERREEKDPTPHTPPREVFLCDFEIFWERYPLKVGRKAALKAYQARRRAGAKPDDILAGLTRYLAFKASTQERHHNPATFLGPNEWWTEPWTIPEAKTAEEKRGNGPGECTVDPKFKRTWAPVITERRVAEPAERGPVGNVRVELPGRGGT